MRRQAPTVFMLLFMVTAVPACKNPRLTYMQAEHAFGAGMSGLNAADKAGVIPKSTADKMTPIINSINEALKTWHAVLDATPEGEKPRVSVATINAFLDGMERLSVFILKYRAPAAAAK